MKWDDSTALRHRTPSLMACIVLVVLLVSLPSCGNDKRDERVVSVVDEMKDQLLHMEAGTPEDREEIEYWRERYTASIEKLETTSSDGVPCVVGATVNLEEKGIVMVLEWIEEGLLASGIALEAVGGGQDRFEQVFDWSDKDRDWMSGSIMKIDVIALDCDAIPWAGGGGESMGSCWSWR